MAAPTIAQIRALFLQYEKESAKGEGEESSDWASIVPASQPELKAALQSALKKSPKNKTLLEIAATFYLLEDDNALSVEYLDRWVQADKKSIKPIFRRMQFYFEDLIDYSDLLGDVKEGLKRKPKSPLVIWLAYQAALKEGDDGRRLHWAVQLADISRKPNHLYLCGVELGRNMMPEKAMIVFKKALMQQPDHVWCINGVGQCYLEQLKLDKAEDCFDRSMTQDVLL